MTHDASTHLGKRVFQNNSSSNISDNIDFPAVTSSSTTVAILLPKWPCRSILKPYRDGEDATVPISTIRNSIGSQTGRPQDRRVSFAEKVQLHKIDIVPFSSGYSPIVCSSDMDEMSRSEGDTSFLALEADADKEVTVLRTGVDDAETDDLQNPHNRQKDALLGTFEKDRSSLSEENSENSMGLTGPILAIPALSELLSDGPKTENLGVGSGIQKGNETPGLGDQGPLKPVESSVRTHKFHPYNHHNDSLPVEHSAGDEFLNMESHTLENTGVFKTISKQDFHFHPDFTHGTTANGLGEIRENNVGNYAPSLTSSEDYLEGEQDMEFTLQVAQFTYEELTMELTLPQPSGMSSMASHSARSDNLQHAVNVFETTMDLTADTQCVFPQELRHENGKNGDNGGEEMTMELTTLAGSGPSQVQVQASMQEEVTMELTEYHCPALKGHYCTEKQKSLDDALEETEGAEEVTNMEITQPVRAHIDSGDTGALLPIIVESQYSEAARLEPDQKIEAKAEKEYDSEAMAVASVQAPTSVPSAGNNPAGYVRNTPPGTRKSRSSELSQRSSSSSISEANLYDGDSLDEAIGTDKYSLRPAMNPSQTKRQKVQSRDAVITETEIHYNDGWVAPNILLLRFLEDVGITFYDDLEIATDVSARYQVSSSGAGGSLQDDYYRANIQLPLLEVYELSCKELAAKIQQGKMLFEEVKERCLQNNPELFKRYLSSSPYEQMSMKAKFHLAKELTKCQAREVWYEWRNKLVRNILQVYQNTLEILKGDESILEAGLDTLDRTHQAVISNIRTLKFDLRRFKEIQSSSKSLNVEEMNNLRTRMNDLNQHLIKGKSRISLKEKAIAALQERMHDRFRVIQSMQYQTVQTEEALNKTRHFNSKEIAELQVASKILLACTGFHFTSNRDNIYQFEVDPRIGITVDTTKLKEPTCVLCRTLETPIKTELYFDELVRLFPDLVNTIPSASVKSTLETLNLVRVMWHKFVLVDAEINRISLKFSIVFRELSAKYLVFDADYLSLDADTKIVFSVSIRMDSVVRYPANVTYEARVSRGEGDTNKLIQHALWDMGKKLTMFTKTRRK